MKLKIMGEYKKGKPKQSRTVNLKRKLKKDVLNEIHHSKQKNGTVVIYYKRPKIFLSSLVREQEIRSKNLTTFYNIKENEQE